MRRSPRRPLILKRRKLPFQQNESSPKLESDKIALKKRPHQASSSCIPDGVCIMDHPTMSATQVVVVPDTADLQTVIGVLTAKGKESGAQGPNKFILLSGSHANPSSDEKNISSQNSSEQNNIQGIKQLADFIKPLGKDLEVGPLDDSLTNIQWLGRMSTCSLEPHVPRPAVNKENAPQMLESCNAEPSPKQPLSERPPYSYMAMIQFAINSKQNKKMTLKEIYKWIEDHFPYFREVAKPGWKNSIRHNLSLHDMFIRETSADGRVSFWTIRPEANRCLTLDQVYTPDSDPQIVTRSSSVLLYSNQQQKRVQLDSKTPFNNERKVKPILPRTDSYLVPIQLPVSSTVYMPLSSSSVQNKQSISHETKKVRIAPKVSTDDLSGLDLKEEVVQVMITTPTKAVVKRASSSSRRKQRLVQSLHEEPVLLCHNNTFVDSGVMSDTSTYNDLADMESNGQDKQSPTRDLSFKTPIKSRSHLTSSTPSKAPSSVIPELWKVTPVGKRSQTVLDFSPIRTPGGPAVTPRHDYTTYSFSSTPFKDLPLISSPRELLTAPALKSAESPDGGLHQSCSRELLQAAGATPNHRSVTEGLVLDTMNDSLSKILVDISFSGLDEEELGMANISWSEFLPQFK